MMNLQEYIKQIQNKLQTGQAKEHSYRPILEAYIKGKLSDSFEVINDGKSMGCGKPDLVIHKKLGKDYIDIGYIETKDIGIDLAKGEKSEQITRYTEALGNFIFTDYLDFRFYVNGKKEIEIKIAEVDGNHVKPLPENFERFEHLIENFLEYAGQKITSSKKLAEMMAKKAKLMKEVFVEALSKESENNTLNDQFKAFQKILIHDLKVEQFADVYAQTITYGLFTARMHDESPENFSRQEARDLIPKSNPFLRQLFDYVSGANLDNRVVWIVDALCQLLALAVKDDILKDFGKQTGRDDPIVHFYETFLDEYDKATKVDRGVWYTPQPVVNFIVRAIDDCLKKYFNLPMGLADTTKVKIPVQIKDPSIKDGFRKSEREFHKVQLLDIATGTGTFLAEVVKQIYNNNFTNQKGMWTDYVENDLLPRLHGFEILMASYAICHLKLDLLLEQTGYKSKTPNDPKRLSVYLTNSLEEAHDEFDNLFGAAWLSKEANAASRIKKQAPVMVAFGNPPYNVSSQNKGTWIKNLIKVYKKDLEEKKINLDDDYIKFIRYAEHYIEKTGYGIVAMITNNSFIDGITHRQMRKHLLETFDAIYIYDLHGSAKKKETASDGGKDENVFNIQQGVSISFFIKYKQDKDKKELAQVLHADLYGKQKYKYEALESNSISTIRFNELEYRKPYYFFSPFDYSNIENYEPGFNLNILFNETSSGVETTKDSFVVCYDEDEAKERVDIINNQSLDAIKEYYKLKSSHIKSLGKGKNVDLQLLELTYRPFDNRVMLYNGTNGIVMHRSRQEITKQFYNSPNIGIYFSRTVYGNYKWADIFTTKCMIEKGAMAMRISNAAIIAPLYINSSNDLGSDSHRVPNLNTKLIKKISQQLTLPLVPDHELPEADGKTAFSPLDLLDYIYAVLHSPSYRTKYKEFLKIDFPRIPYPEKSTFWQLVALGKQIRELHLLESPKLSKLITGYNISGDDVVDKIKFEPNTNGLGNVYINKTQYFEGVPEISWNFYIGGYQPAQKWLKDRKGRSLNNDDKMHYQKVIIALLETDKLMKQIDEVIKI